MAKEKQPHEPGRVVKGPGTVRWKVIRAAQTVAAVVREKKDQKRTGKG